MNKVEDNNIINMNTINDDDEKSETTTNKSFVIGTDKSSQSSQSPTPHHNFKPRPYISNKLKTKSSSPPPPNHLSSYQFDNKSTSRSPKQRRSSYSSMSSHSASEYVYLYIPLHCILYIHTNQTGINDIICCMLIYSLLNLANHSSDSPSRDNNNNGQHNGHQAQFNHNNNSNGNHPNISSNSNSNGSNGTSRQYKTSSKFAITRKNIRSSSGAGYNSLSSKSVSPNKTQFGFPPPSNNNNDSPPANRRIRTISPRADGARPIQRRQFQGNNNLSRLPSGTDIISGRSKSNPNILGMFYIKYIKMRFCEK